MGTHHFYIDNSYVISIPPHVHNQFNQLPYELKNHFDSQYKNKSKNMLLAYALLFVAWAPYAYRGQWVKQILFWITFGAGGIWAFYTWCILWYRIKSNNEELAEHLMKDCILRLQTNYGAEQQINNWKVDKNLTPKELDIEYNPASLTVNNLQDNFLVDYKTRTWEVKRHWQQDFENAESERFYLLEHDFEQLFITIKHENFLNSYFCSQLVNIHVIDSQIQNMIYSNETPKNIIHYQGQQYYKEIKKVGTIFDLSKGENPRKITQWDYYTEDRNMCLTISQIAQDKISAYAGFKVNPNSFTDILPRSIHA